MVQAPMPDLQSDLPSVLTASRKAHSGAMSLRVAPARSGALLVEVTGPIARVSTDRTNCLQEQIRSLSRK